MIFLAALCVVGWLLFAWNAIATNNEISTLDKLRRNDARTAAERWEVLQERHDAVIELIAQIAEAKAEVKGAPKQKRKKAT